MNSTFNIKDGNILTQEELESIDGGGYWQTKVTLILGGALTMVGGVASYVGSGRNTRGRIKSGCAIACGYVVFQGGLMY